MVIRDIGSISGTEVIANAIPGRFYFVRMDFKSNPPGQLFMTNKPGGYSGNIGDNLEGSGGGDQDWLVTDFRIQHLSQSQNNVLDVSALDFANGTPGNIPVANAVLVDGYWSNILQAYTMRETPVGVYVVWFDADDAPTGMYQIFGGQIDSTRMGVRAEISLAPFSTSHAQIIPAREYAQTCQNEYTDPETCQVDPDIFALFPGCPRTVAACNERQNIIHFTGFPLTPQPNDTLVWGTGRQIRFQPG